LELPVTLLREGARLPSRAHEGDAGLDLHALEAATIPAGGRASIGTGIAVEIPPGHAGLVLPRSGLAAKHGIALVNSPGLIDSGYRGEVRVLLLNTDRARPFEVHPGDRIAQLLVTPFVEADAVEVAALTDPAASVRVAPGPSGVGQARGAGGFGSSGR
jgi:dUTP pyrophosphatase